MDKSKILIIVIILLIIIMGGISFFAFRQVQENKEMTELFAIEKEEMENEYNTFATQYDELQVQINNDSLRIKLEREKLNTQRLLEELRQVKASNAAEIMRLKKELKTVRAVMRSYVMQIDSLNRINEALTTENKQVKQKYTEATRQINTLAQEKKNLNEKVTLAAQLDATNIIIEPKNKKGKVTKSLKRITNIEICFQVLRNITAERGYKTIYIRIADANGEVLNTDGKTFEFEGKELIYSAKKEIEYNGENTPVCIYYKVTEPLETGSYSIAIFAEGNLIGTTGIVLK